MSGNWKECEDGYRSLNKSSRSMEYQTMTVFFIYIYTIGSNCSQVNI